MLIQCPNCTTSYELPDGSVNASGRKVRCSACKTVWQVLLERALPEQAFPEAEAVLQSTEIQSWDSQLRSTLPEQVEGAGSGIAGSPGSSLPDNSVELAAANWETEMESDPDAMIVASDTMEEPGTQRINLKIERTTDDDLTAPSESELDNSQDDIDALFDTPSAEEFGAAATTATEAETEAGEPGAKIGGLAGALGLGAALTSKARQKTESLGKLGWRKSKSGQKNRKKPASRFPVAASLAALIFLGFGAGTLYREKVVAVVPQMAKLYKLVGLPVNLRGVVIQNVSSRIILEQGTPELIVEGEIVNISHKPAKLARLRFAIRSEQGREIYSWKATADKPAIDSGETLKFRRKLSTPPEEGQDVLVRFETRGDMVAGVQ